MVKLIERKEVITKYILEVNQDELQMIADSVSINHMQIFNSKTEKFPSNVIASYYILSNSLQDILRCKND